MKKYQASEQETALLQYVEANTSKTGWCTHSIKRMQTGLGLERPRDVRKMTSDLIMNCLLDIDIASGHLRVLR